MQTEAPLSKVGEATSYAPPAAQSVLDGDEALAALHIAVQNHDYAAAEFIFDHTPALDSDPNALELVVRNFCNMRDFTTAKAVLLQVQAKMTAQGFIKFMIACFRSSENSDDLQEAFEAAIKRFPKDASVAATALLGFKILQDRPRIDATQAYCAENGLTRQIPLLQIKVYDCYASGDFSAALELGRTIAARRTDEPASLLRPDLPYRWALRLFAQEGNLEAIETVQSHMAELQVPATASLSNIILGTLPVLYPKVPLVEWLKKCHQWGWELDGSSFAKLAKILYRWYPAQHAQISRMHKSLMRGLGTAATPHRGDLELAAIQNFVKVGEPAKCLYILDSMRRRGIMPPFYFHVLIFEALAKRGLTTELEQLVAKMKAVGYPRHCAGTDLAMLELQLRQAATGKNRSRSEKHADAQRGLLWVNQYLLEYPLVQHNLSQLTRIATLFIHCRQPDIAAQVVDFLRWQSETGEFAAHNHDSRSIGLLLFAAKQRGQSPELLLDSLLADRPRIFLDLKLKRRVRELVSPERWNHYLNAIKRHNEWVKADIADELTGLAQFVKLCT